MESAERFFNLFDLKKLEGYGEILAKKIGLEKDIEIKKIKSEFDATMKKQEYATEFISRQYTELLDAFLDALDILPSRSREQLIYSMNEGMTKKIAVKANERFKEIEERRRVALSKAFLESMRERENKSNDR